MLRRKKSYKMDTQIEPSSYDKEKKPKKFYLKKLPALLALVLLISLSWFGVEKYLIKEDNPQIQTYFDESIARDLCSRLTGTPAWFIDGEIDSVGYIEFPKERMSEIVDELIKEEVYFVYSSNCGWCHKQIEDFWDEWERYEQSGLTIDCLEVW